MLPDRVSNPGPLTYKSGALPIALLGRLIFRRDQPFLTLISSVINTQLNDMRQIIYLRKSEFYI